MNIPASLNFPVVNTPGNLDSPVVNTQGSLDSPVMNTRGVDFLAEVGKVNLKSNGDEALNDENDGFP
jgi:hypothetical protein